MKIHTINNQYFQLLKESYPDRNNYITHRYMLPFRLPVHASTYMVLEDIVFVFLQRAYNKHYANPDVGFTGGRLKHTIVEATQIITKSKHDNIHDYMRKKPNVTDLHHSEVFDKQFKVLNDFCETILVSKNFYNIDELTLNNIVGVPYYRLFEVKGEQIKTNSEGPFFVHNTNLYREMNEYKMNMSEFNSVINNYKYVKQNPYFQFELYLQKGFKSLKEEDFNQTIVLYQTALEILVKKVIIDYYSIQNLKKESEIENLKKDTKFKNHINHHFKKMIANLRLPNELLIIKILDKYLNEPLERRHNIVHEGRSYSREEALENSRLVTDIFNLFLYDIHQADKNNYIEYLRNLYTDVPDINEISIRYKTKIK